MIDFSKKLKKEDNAILQQFASKKYQNDEFIDIDFLDLLCALSTDYNSEFVVLFDRVGNVVDVTMGNNNSAPISVTKTERGLNGIRLIHTHPNASSELSKLDESILTKNNMDCVCAVSCNDKGPQSATASFLGENGIDTIKVPNAYYINKSGLLEKIIECEKTLKQRQETTYKTENSMERAILVKVSLESKTPLEDIIELESLAQTAHLQVVDKVIQNKAKPDVKFLIGEGKLETLKESVQLNSATVVIFDNTLNGNKIFNLQNVLGIKVIDRSMLILDIFAGRARTSEGKLQVELAQLKYSLPRLNSLTNAQGRFGGGVGMRGPGETKLELNRRIIEDAIKRKERELENLKEHREINRVSRTKGSKKTVAIVGYTNSGKSTLMNLLSKSDVFVENELFATLDTTTRSVWLREGKEIILTDTVGFIKNLPHEFIEAFGSTLEESVHADVLIHVIDCSNPNYIEQEHVVNDVLKKLKCTSPIIVVYNKIDKLSLEKLQEITNSNPQGLFISAKTHSNIEALKDKIIEVAGV